MRLFVILFMISLSSCMRTDENQSKLTWGHLGYLGDRLIQLLPRNTIAICGEYRSETSASIRAWAREIGRETGLTYDTSCPNSADKTITVYGVSTSVARDECERSERQLGWHPGALALSDGIALCSDYGVDAMILHESGHMWGLCDQYEKDNVKNCDEQHQSAGKDPSSIMAASHGSSLTSDDINGIRALADRTDITANQRWREYLNSGEQERTDDIRYVCTDCESGRRYCGSYNYSSSSWVNGSYENCGSEITENQGSGCSESDRSRLAELRSKTDATIEERIEYWRLLERCSR